MLPWYLLTLATQKIVLKSFAETVHFAFEHGNFIRVEWACMATLNQVQ